MTTADDPYDDEVFAAEYVLHLLDASERQRFETRLRDDAGLRQLVHRWEAQLVPIADEIEEVMPPAHVRTAIMAKIAQTPSSPPFWRRWSIGILGIAVAMLIAVFAFGPLLRGTVDLTPQFQAELTSEDGTIILIAGVIPPTHEIVIERFADVIPEGRVLELWLIAQGSDLPVSLGLLEAEGLTRIRVPDDIAPGVRTGTVAISEEPPGGSPTGMPTGQILATGTFKDI
ncbi:anti-sigma factor [Roseobacter sp. EG26]|uniref:anti-sigma factor n=1 Tax=Roseobacter sp. EG26 TaxID=3412477 RepID=UPI003CE55959